LFLASSKNPTLGETAMAGVTEKKIRGTGKYLLLHRSGVVARTKTLEISEPVGGITAIINLETLEQYNGEQWEKIPVGFDTLIAAEAEEELYNEDEEDEDLSPDAVQLGARRIFCPQVVWAYAKAKL